MEEFETLDGIIKIKEIIPLNTWEFPIATSVRIKTIKKVLKKEIPVKGIIHIIFRHRSFFDSAFATQQSNEQWLVNILQCEYGCNKIVSEKIILEKPFYDTSQNKMLIYGIQVRGEYIVSNNYLKMHEIHKIRRIAGRKGVKAK
nr:MAG TPA: hypothetical protein [Caudoviricetes sp.]